MVDRSLDTLERRALCSGVVCQIETSELLSLIASARELERVKAELASAELELKCRAGTIIAIVAAVPGAEHVNVISRIRKLVDACEPFKKAWDDEKYHRGISLHHWRMLGSAMALETPSEAYALTPSRRKRGAVTDGELAELVDSFVMSQGGICISDRSAALVPLMRLLQKVRATVERETAEACAGLCDSIAKRLDESVGSATNRARPVYRAAGASECDEAIRARFLSKPEEPPTASPEGSYHDDDPCDGAI